MHRRELLKTTASALAGTVTLTGATATAASGQFSDAYLNGYHYRKYVPTEKATSPALVVMLHGCSQEPGEFARATRMNEVAEREGFVAIYPDQSSFANSFDCWNWFYDYNTERGSGEGAIITDMATHEVSDESLDPDSVYVAGFSAGAAMVPNLLAAYPDVYAAGGVHSGLEYDAADNSSEATYAMTWGGPDPYLKGEQAYDAMQYNGVVGRVPTVVFHGTDDTTVYPVNGDQVTVQAIETNDLASDGLDDGNVDTAAESDVYGSTGGYDWRRRRFGDDSGTTLVEYWEVEGMDHAWAGGAPGEAYTAPSAPDASDALWSFFSRW
ncbi:extracellular catalytic domain type 1 short-chain-length polyhydroxyalkanoate depolymerase [Haloarchaeobius sp. TZWWS8]|uniref:extracellular catalytic domain type 1 short-chain-length polyhydroxyalkanoate depolymerase n=1 Tax=Haloarchaeobius sp. TZWWS8 TaxID=3446121 RepID=UPI003EB954FC